LEICKISETYQRQMYFFINLTKIAADRIFRKDQNQRLSVDE